MINIQILGCTHIQMFCGNTNDKLMYIHNAHGKSLLTNDTKAFKWRTLYFPKNQQETY
jgi:hypothetical protein